MLREEAHPLPGRPLSVDDLLTVELAEAAAVGTW